MTDQVSLRELQGTYSDYHKDLMGFRPKALPEQWEDEAWLRARMGELDAHFDAVKTTFEGRERLREEGWCLPAEEDLSLRAISEANAAKRNARYEALRNAVY